MTSLVSRARSLLFVPASRPERFAKALDAGAGCVVLDLEDAVSPDQKIQARHNLASQLPGFTPEQLQRTLVRINPVGTPWFEDDLALLSDWGRKGLAGIMVPKAEDAAVLRDIGAALGGSAALVPLIESLAGLDALDALARVPGVARFAFGHLDFQLDLRMRCEPEESELTPVRFALVATSRRAQLAAPIDGVTADTRNSERLLQDAQRACAFGFGAKLCIHPNQVGAVNDTFAPSAVEVEWARRVVDEARSREGEAFSLDGKMVDLPVILQAKETLRQAEY